MGVIEFNNPLLKAGGGVKRDFENEMERREQEEKKVPKRSTMSAAERAKYSAPKKVDPNAGKALKVVWDVRKPDGQVETKEAILCPEHKDQIFSRYPNARGTGEYFPAKACQSEMCQKHHGAVCGNCGNTMTNGEYSSGESKCCKAEVVPEEQYGMQASAKTAHADDWCEACGEDVANRECAHGLLCDKCDAEVHGTKGGKCKVGAEEPYGKKEDVEDMDPGSVYDEPPAPAAPPAPPAEGKYTKFVVVVQGEQWVRYQKRNTRRPIDFYITAVTFKPDGMAVKSFNYSPDKEKARQFGKLTAEGIVKCITGPGFGSRARVEKA